jgi:hypothetical protein
MDTASQIVRAKYQELLDGQIALGELSAWLDVLPIPATMTSDFKPFMRLVIGAQCRLLLWSDGAPEMLVIDSLRRLVNELDGASLIPSSDPLDPFKRRYERRIRSQRRYGHTEPQWGP